MPLSFGLLPDKNSVNVNSLKIVIKVSYYHKLFFSSFYRMPVRKTMFQLRQLHCQTLDAEISSETSLEIQNLHLSSVIIIYNKIIFMTLNLLYLDQRRHFLNTLIIRYKTFSSLLLLTLYIHEIYS